MSKQIVVGLTEAEARALWSLADMAGDYEDVVGGGAMRPAQFEAGRRAMDKLKDARHPVNPATGFQRTPPAEKLCHCRHKRWVHDNTTGQCKVTGGCACVTFREAS